MTSHTHHGMETNGVDDLGRAIESSLSFDQPEQPHDPWQLHNSQQPFYSRDTAVRKEEQSPNRVAHATHNSSQSGFISPISPRSSRPRAYSGASPNHYQQAPAPSGASLSPRHMAYRLPHNSPMSLSGEPVGLAPPQLPQPVRVSPPPRLGSPIAESTPPLHERNPVSPSSPSHVPVRHGDSWNQEGAATLVRKTTDEQGNVTTRVIKKGVEDFEFKEELGTGSYSTVVAASDKQTLRQYAIKILDKAHIIKEGKVKYVEIEKNTLTRLGDHPGIIHLYYTFQDRASLFFVLDFAPNGELLQLIKRMGSINEEGARYYAAQLLDAIDYMHSKGVIHRDLKPENILLDYKMRIKITDFGTAKLLEADPTTNEYPIDNCRADSFVGTAEYVSPELLSQKTQGKSADIWAFGCVLFQMIAGSPPFQGSTQYLTFQRIVKYQWTAPPGFPVLVRDLLKNVFVSPRRRLQVDEIKAHPFFEDQDWSPRALWNSNPPRLMPYKPTSQSLASSRLPKSRSQQIRRPVAPRPSPAVIPTAAGLAPVQPATRAGVPSSSAPRSNEALTTSPRAPLQPGRPVSASSAAAAALSRSATSPRTPRAPTPQSHSQSYQQSQERLQELTRRVRERTNQRPVSGGPSLHVNTQVQRRSTPPLHRPAMSSPNLGGYSPSSPKSPNLTLPNLTATEGEWSTVLISSNERILRIGKVTVYAGNNIGLSECTSAVDTEHRVAKLMSSRHKREWTLMVTTAGRLVVIGSDRKVRVEVPLGVPQVEIQIVTFVKRDGAVLAVETYNRAIVISDEQGSVKEWMSTIELSRKYYAQATAEQERNAFSAAAAAACAVSGLRR